MDITDESSASSSAGGTRLWWVDGGGARRRPPEDLPVLIERDDGWIWLDIPTLDPAAQTILAELYSFHPRAVRDCAERNHMPKVHIYQDHVFLAVHAPEPGEGGHVHYVELDQFVGPRFLITVHGPLNPVVPLETSLRQTRDVAQRLEAGRLHPGSPFALSAAVVSSIVRHEEELVGGLARTVGLLEQQVMARVGASPELFLEDLFQARHALLTVRTMAAQSREVYGRMLRVAGFIPEDGRRSLDDVLDQYDRLRRITDGQLAFLHGVTEFYRARTDTKMTIAAERLAVIAAVTLPVTALSSILGMNVIVNSRTHWVALLVLCGVMTAMSLWVLRWARRQGWW